MKTNEKKTIAIWILAILVVVLVVVLAVLTFGQKSNNQGNPSTQAAGSIVESTEESKTSQPAGLEETKSPQNPGEPEVTEEPETTEVPETTKEANVTPQPEATTLPETTKVPAVTEDGRLPALKVDGTQLCDVNGNPVQLRGISTHGIGWFPQYVNEECFKQLKEEWNANVVRLAMYTAENDGYCTDGNKDSLKQLVKDGVAYATNQNLYVIIDWHVLNDQNPNTYKEEAKVFFEEMSKEYKDYTNVIYEICNEPNGGVSWKDVKSYAEEVIGVIRENDEDAVIIVGTPNWSQYVDQAAGDPITTSDNIMYALHFYAATHTDNLRTQMKNAVNNGLPVFVSEYGICDASGNGGIDYNQANAWVEAMDDLGISYIAWNLSNKNETSAIIRSSCNKTSGFTSDDLSDSGKWLYELLTGREVSDFTPSNTGSKQNQQSQSNNSGQQTTQPTIAPAANISTGEGLTIEAEAKDSWESPEGKNCNYSLTIINDSGKDVDGWKITLNFTENISAVQGWSGNFTIEGKSLHITNVDYNSKIPAGESVKDIGFIITGGSNIELVE